MRVLMVCTDAEIGGAERFLASLARAKRPEDRVALAVLMRPGSLSEQLEASFDEVHYLGFGPSSRNIFGMVRALEHVMNDFQPDVVASHLFHADIVTALSRTNAAKVTTVHTQGLTKSDHPLTRLIARAVGLLSFRFDAVIPAGSSAQMAAFIRSLNMKNVVSAIPNGATVSDTPKFDSSSRILVSLARNHPVKGHKHLFKAFAVAAADSPDWVLQAYGPGVIPSDASMLEAIKVAGAEDLLSSGRILLAGPTSAPEQVLEASSALVISSIYGEAFPIVGAEAAGLGIPVITTDLGSCAEFADDARFLVPPDNAAALAQSLGTYMHLNDSERENLSALAFARANSQYHPRVAYERYREVFSYAISRHG